MSIERGRYFVTHKCNLRCPYCLTNSGEVYGKEYEPEELKPIFIKLQKSGMRSIGISGGEPFLVFDRTYNAVKILREVGINSVRVFTNGTLTTEEKVIKLKNAGTEAFHISIDGMENNHDTVRGKGNFSKAIETIKIMKSLNCRVRTVTLLRPENFSDAMEIFKLLKSLEVDEIYFKEINTSVGRGTTYKTNKLDMRSLPLEIRNDKNVVVKEYGNFKAECSAISVNPDGSIISCGQVQEYFGNGFTDKIDRIFKNRRMCHFRDIKDNKNGSGNICCDY